MMCGVSWCILEFSAQVDLSVTTLESCSQNNVNVIEHRENGTVLMVRLFTSWGVLSGKGGNCHECCSVS